MPAVSLIIPVYNVEKYLWRCIDSIAGQSFSDFEAIFVNDGSTDNSAELCQRLIAPYSNMRMVSKQNGGLSSARLCGYNESVGEFVAFIDSDDYLHPDYLKTLYVAITKNNADISLCSYFIDDGIEQRSQSLYFGEDCSLTPEEYLDKYLLPQLPSTKADDKLLPSFMWLRMVKKSILDEFMFVSERNVFKEDLIMSLMLNIKSPTVEVVHMPLYYYCINPGSLTLKYREGMWKMLMRLMTYVTVYIQDCDNPKVQSRIDGFYINSILISLRNASIKGLPEYRKTVRHIRQAGYTHSLFARSGSVLIRKYKILLLMFCLRMPSLLYFYYRKNL